MTAAAYFDKARRALSGAHLLLAAGDSEGACSRAYYAMFDASRAALMTVQVEGADAAVKTHRGLIAAFGKHLVLTGLVDAEFGRAFNRVQSLRATADYVGVPLSRDDAAWAIAQADAFLRVLEDRFSSP